MVGALRGHQTSRVVVMDQLLDVGQLLVEVLEVPPCLLVISIPLVPLILRVNSCLNILKQSMIKS